MRIPEKVFHSVPIIKTRMALVGSKTPLSIMAEYKS